MVRRAAALDSTFFFPTMIEGWINLEVGKFREAVPLLKKAATMDAPPFVTAYLAYALGAGGDRAAAMQTLAVLRKMSPMDNTDN